jgi:hypothetical protein
MDLDGAATLAGWPTPAATDTKGANPENRMRDGKPRPLSDEDLPTMAQMTGWPTPAARDWKSGDASQETLDQNARPLSEIAILSGWNTPRATDGSNVGPNQANGALSADAAMCGWATPQSRDHFPAHSDEYVAAKMAEGHGMANLNDQVTLAGWATPDVNSGERLNRNPDNIYKQASGAKAQVSLIDQARLTDLSGWSTPSATERSGLGDRNVSLYQQARLTASGEGPIGFILGPNGWETHPASGQLNPALSRWLQSIPEIWCRCAIRASRSLKAKKRASSASKDMATQSS